MTMSFSTSKANANVNDISCSFTSPPHLLNHDGLSVSQVYVSTQSHTFCTKGDDDALISSG